MPLRVFVFVVLVLVLPLSAQAQDDNASEKWYWAWREETGELLAYTASGAVNILPLSLKNPELLQDYEYWRLSDQLGLLLIWEQYLSSFALYQITSDSVKPIELLFDLAKITFNINMV